MAGDGGRVPDVSEQQAEVGASVALYGVRALGVEWHFDELRLARDFARQLRNRGHAVEVWARSGSAGGRLNV